MKAFRFPLHAILTLREEKEQEAQREYARKLRAVEAITAQISAVDQQLSALAQEHERRMRTGLAVADLERLGFYAELLHQRRTYLRQELARAQHAAEQARLALVKATQARQALENYRGKQRRVYDQSLAREEQKLLDDLAGRTGTLADAWRQTAEMIDP